MKKIKLPIKNIETNIILNALIQFKNDKLKQGIYTETIDELILKLNKIYIHSLSLYSFSCKCFFLLVSLFPL